MHFRKIIKFQSFKNPQKKNQIAKLKEIQK